MFKGIDDLLADGILQEMSVADMHALAKEIRAEGGEIFFAAIGG